MREPRDASTDRRFARQVCAAFGVLFVVGGYAAAFTEMGAGLL